MTPPDTVRALVARLAREHTGRLVAGLLRVLGAGRLDLAEDCVQEAFLSALSAWSASDPPADPVAWLLTAARNRARDRLRRQGMAAALEPRMITWLEALQRPVAPDTGTDGEVMLIALCCHPALESEARLALTLKAVCGFSVPEIARAFLATPAAVEQRLVRAKRRVAELGLTFDRPAGPALAARRPSILKTIYLLFTEGHAASAGDRPIRHDICAEALRLAETVADDPALSAPEAHALAALIAFQHARGPARLDSTGDLVLLAEQDRSLWDRALMARGFARLRAAQAGDRLTSYHLEAGIASVHAMAPAWTATRWDLLLSHYDALADLDPSPVVRINRAVVLAETAGPAPALRVLEGLPRTDDVLRYVPYWLALGDLRAATGDRPGARDAYDRALDLPGPDAQRTLIARKRANAADA